MRGGIIIAIYVLGVLLGAAVCGLCDEEEFAPLALFWPFILPFIVLFGGLIGIARLAERYR